MDQDASSLECILITGTTPYWGGSWEPISQLLVAEMWDYILY
jgi:hypothetical protein